MAHSASVPWKEPQMGDFITLTGHIVPGFFNFNARRTSVCERLSLVSIIRVCSAHFVPHLTWLGLRGGITAITITMMMVIAIVIIVGMEANFSHFNF